MVQLAQSSRTGTTQNIVYNATVPVTNAFGASTYQIKIVSNANCHYHIYDSTGSATATAADPFLPQLWVEYITVTPGQKISAIAAATDGNVTTHAGTLWITELS